MVKQPWSCDDCAKEPTLRAARNCDGRAARAPIVGWLDRRLERCPIAIANERESVALCVELAAEIDKYRQVELDRLPAWLVAGAQIAAREMDALERRELERWQRRRANSKS